MSTPLKEIRIYVPESAHILLSGRAEAFGEDIGAVTKRIVMEHVKREMHAMTVINRRFRNTGIEPDMFGDAAEPAPTQPGTSRK